MQHGSRLRAFLRRARDVVLGRTPSAHPWHPRWPDYETIIGTVKESLPNELGDLVLLSATPAVFSGWLAPLGKTSVELETRRVLNVKDEEYAEFVGKFDGCLLFLREDEFDLIKDYIARTLPLLRPHGALVIALFNGYGIGMETQLCR